MNIGITRQQLLETALVESSIKKIKPQPFANDLSKLPDKLKIPLTYLCETSQNQPKESSLTYKSFINDIIHKRDLCKDTSIKAQVDDILSKLSLANSGYSISTLCKAELLLDSVNTANGEYCTLFSANTPFGKGEILKQALKNSPLSESAKEKLIKQELKTYSEPRKLYAYALENPKITLNAFVSMKSVCKYTSIKEFIEYWGTQEPEVADYLWKKYFVKNQDKQSQNFLNQINKNFGVKVFKNSPEYCNKLKFLLEEFKIWKKAGKDEVRYPLYYDMQKDHFLYVNNAGAYTNLKKIVCPEDEVEEHTRHEMKHINDNNLTLNIFPKKILRTFKELYRAGVDLKHILYALIKTYEKKAVSVAAGMQNFTRKYKEILYREGVPRMVEDLQPLSVYKAELYNKFPKAKYQRIFKKLEKALGQEMSGNLALFLSMMPKQYISLIENICRKSKGLPLNEELFLTLFANKIQQTEKHFPSNKINLA